MLQAAGSVPSEARARGDRADEGSGASTSDSSESREGGRCEGAGGAPPFGLEAHTRRHGTKSLMGHGPAAEDGQGDAEPALPARTSAVAAKKRRVGRRSRLELLALSRRESAAATAVESAKTDLSISYHESRTEYVLLGMRLVNGVMQTFSASSPGLATFDKLVGGSKAMAIAFATHQAHQGRAIRAYGDADKPFAELPLELQQRIVHALLQVLVHNRKRLHPWYKLPRQQAQQGQATITEGRSSRGRAPAMQGRLLAHPYPRIPLLPGVLQLQQPPSLARRRTAGAVCVVRTHGFPTASCGSAH